MRNRQIDLRIGESIEVGGHTVTVHRIDEEGQQAVLEIEDSGGSVKKATINVATMQLEEPALV